MQLNSNQKQLIFISSHLKSEPIIAF